MKISVRKVTTVVFGVATVALVAVFAFGQANGPARPDPWADVSITTTKLGTNVYAMEGTASRPLTRARWGILAGADGVLVVDSYYGEMAEKSLEAIRKVSTAPIRYLVNTHGHPDHTGGNAAFKKASPNMTIMSTVNLRERAISKPAEGTFSAFWRGGDPAYFPTLTYEGPVTIYMNNEKVRLIPLPPAHTDGDTMVYFENNHVMMLGDVVRNSGYPNIDGSVQGFIDALGIAIGMATPKTVVNHAHGPMTDRAGMIAQREMIMTVRDRVAKLIKDGTKNLDEVVAAKPTADFDAKVLGEVHKYYDTNSAHGRTYLIPYGFLGQIYNELTRQPAQNLRPGLGRPSPPNAH
jgi:glyoxylase-like metal-dependent hydrolase (beta-lactamase superfamily II)